MDLTNIENIKKITKENSLWAKKKFGQNFLVSSEILEKIIETAKITDQDTIIEIGPGLGTLTQELAKNAKLVLAIEKDRDMVEWLRKYFHGKKNVKIICEDILQFSNYNNYNIVSNLPYNITSPVIRKFLEAENKPSKMVLMVQKEVAERICAKPGNRERGFLTVLVEFYAEAEIIKIVSKENFWPMPSVESAIIKVTLRPQKGSGQEFKVNEKVFFNLVKAGFSQKRRQIHNSLAGSLNLPKNVIDDILNKSGINAKSRAEDLSLEEWKKIYVELQNILGKYC